MTLRETDLYGPIKAYLERQGYAVKGEIKDCDVVAVRGEDEVVVVEMKATFSLQLVFQALRRLALTDAVYVAYGIKTRTRRDARDIVKLCRMLGLGLMTVRLGGRGEPVEVHLDPGPYKPRVSKPRRGMLLREFARRVGDPNTGGANKRALVTAYRQDALRCARHLSSGPAKVAAVREATGVETAQRILQNDVYGWFVRVERGVYALTPNGERALEDYAAVIATLNDV